ncbi:MAG: hypothetical protein HKP25_13610 [Marinicaulis sp.]|nr:hypothetical protein [Marinicaulis sp.]
MANNQPPVEEEAAQDAPPGAIIEMPAIDDADEAVQLPPLGEAEFEESPDSGQADDAASLPVMDKDAEDKLANTVAEDISPEAVGVIAGDNLETALEDGEVFLPPLPDAEAEVGGNKSFVADAKSALVEIDETESEQESGFTLSEDAAQDGANNVDTEAQSPTGSESDNANLNSEDIGRAAAIESDPDTNELSERSALAAISDEESGPQDPPVAEEKIAGLSAGEIEALKAALAEQTQELTVALDAERAKTATLEDQIAQMRADFAEALDARDAQMRGEIAAIRAEVLKLENRTFSENAEAAVNLAALDRLASAVEKGEPYSTELNAVAKFVDDPAALDALRRHGAGGVATMRELKAAFPEAARDGIAAASKETQKGPARWFGGLLNVRPADATEGDSPGAVISRVEAALSEDKLPDALRELAAMSPAGLGAMADWREKAAARNSALAAIQVIRADATR